MAFNVSLERYAFHVPEKPEAAASLAQIASPFARLAMPEAVYAAVVMKTADPLVIAILQSPRVVPTSKETVAFPRADKFKFICN